MPNQIKVDAGERYGNLVIISEADKVLHGSVNRRAFLCRCSCGNEVVITLSSLRHNSAKSCGCMKLRTTHGKSYSREYRIWLAMINRCTNKNYRNFHNYGGRGITVCDRWIHSFDNFYADMGSCPSNKSSIDRIDNEKGYCATSS